MNRMQLSTMRGITWPESWGEEEGGKAGNIRGEGWSLGGAKFTVYSLEGLSPCQVIFSKHTPLKILLKEPTTTKRAKKSSLKGAPQF